MWGGATENVGIYAVPAVIVFVVIFGAVKKVDLFETFKDGAKEGISGLLSIAPSLIGLIVAVTMLQASGFFDIIIGVLEPVCRFTSVPPEVLPLGLMRPVSGSGSFALLNSLLDKYGADSYIGRVASVMAGSTETTFYAIAVYYGSVGIKDTRHTIPAALTADMFGMFFSALCCKMF